jgi:predicted HTH domain antitoxin
MSVQITLELPEDVFSIVRSHPDGFVREFRLAAAVKWYELGRISQSKAAELAGISRQEFIDSLDRFAAAPFQVTPEELGAELALTRSV